MKLFSQKEVKDAEQDRLAELLKREAQLNDAITKKEKEFNATKIEIEAKILSIQSEYKEKFASSKRSLSVMEREALILEERRQAALKPILDELNTLALARESLSVIEDGLKAKEVSLDKEQASLRAERTKILLSKSKIEREQAEAAAKIEQDTYRAEKAKQEAILLTQRMNESEKSASIALGRLKDQEESLRRAEIKARAAMALADSRIAEEKEEQKKTDAKRDMLAITINVLKKKGLWRTAREMQTK